MENLELIDTLHLFRNKKVLITGNSGFKGSWLTMMLLSEGADVIGYSLPQHVSQSIFMICGLDKKIKTYYEDIRDYTQLKRVFDTEKPEIVFHLAAQPLVRESYKVPLYTYDCNVMGTANILECIRTSHFVKSFVNVTTDKVYQNNEWEWGYRENDVLDGYDPYSNSKSCSELITASYKRSFEKEICAAISTARAGNVIGGGDFSKDRIIPDCFRAAENNQTITVRNPDSVRPYQHVIEPLFAYMLIAAVQYNNKVLSDCFNVGPAEEDCITTGNLVKIFCDEWGSSIKWQALQNNGPHEANFLSLDCLRIKQKIGWSPFWSIKEALKNTVVWYKAYLEGKDMYQFSINQINQYYNARRFF